jgi:hypothetical protein
MEGQGHFSEVCVQNHTHCLVRRMFLVQKVTFLMGNSCSAFR